MKMYPIKKLGEVLEKIVGGGTPSKNSPAYWGGNIPWASVKDFKEGVFILKGTRDSITEDGLKNSAANLIPKGTLVISTRMGLGRVAKTEINTAINQDLKALFPKKGLDANYLFLFLRSKAQEIIKKGSGATVSGIRLEHIRNLEIPLPPLAEQKKIVARLEKLLAKVKEAKRLRIEARVATQSLLSAELHKIFEEGKKRGWEEKAINDIADVVQYGYTASARENGNAQLLRITDIQGGEVKWDAVPFCECANLERYKLFDGDIVFARTGATVGKSYLINNPPENAIFASYLIRVSMNREQCLPELLYYFFQSRDYWERITGYAVGGAQPNVNGSKLKKIKIPLPPLTEQKKIVERLDALSAELKRIEEYQQSTQADLDRLEQSILHRAFSGE